MKFDHVSFWVRTYDMPIGMSNMTSAMTLGARLGEVLEVDESTIVVYEKFLRIRVRVDITKQLRRGIMVPANGKKMWIMVKYERLPKFCYLCGKIGHVESDCENEEAKQYHSEYGEWLWDSPMKNLGGRQEGEGLRYVPLRQERDESGTGSGDTKSSLRRSILQELETKERLNEKEYEGGE